MALVIHPLNRGIRPIKVVLDTNYSEVTNCQATTTYYWDFAKLLRGKNPLDAIQLTQRSNGIDYVAHAIAAARALEEMAQVKVPVNAQIIRNLLLALETIYGHITYFYQNVLPDYIPYPGSGVLNESDGDFRISSGIQDVIMSHVWNSYEIRRDIHGLISILGGKAPHICSIIPGGVTKSLGSIDLVKAKSIIKDVTRFINQDFSYDIWQIKKTYAEYFHIGRGCGRLLTLGEFPQKDNSLQISPRTFNGSEIAEASKNQISVECTYSWFEAEAGSTEKTVSSKYKPIPGKTGAYSWMKGLVYDKQTYETGALARMYLTGNKVITDLGKGAISVMGRYRARLEECARLVEFAAAWLEQLDLKEKAVVELEIPSEGQAVGVAEGSVGPVVHYVSLGNEKINNYNVFDSLSWNLCPTSQSGQFGPLEQSLVGMSIPNGKYPVSIYRIARSF